MPQGPDEARPEPTPVQRFRCERLLAGADADIERDVLVTVADGVIEVVEPYRRGAAAGRLTELAGLVLPGFVDAHSHLRGVALAEQDVEDGPLETWLLWLRTLTELDPADEALVAAVDLLGTGVTTVQGILHGFADRAAYELEIGAVAGALADAGIRAELMIGLTDQAEYLPAGAAPAPGSSHPVVERGLPAAGLGDLVRGAQATWTGPSLRVGVAPVAPQWCSDELLEQVKTLVRQGFRVHTHLLESAAQRDWTGEDPVTRLQRWDLVGPALSAAHGVWLSAGEVNLLAQAGPSVVHCASSNKGLEVGSADVRGWLDSGLSVAIGLDSHPIAGRVDLYDELREAATTATRRGSELRARELLAMATLGGAAAVGRPGELGRIAPGYRADLVAVQPPAGGQEDPVEHLLAHASAADVATVLVGGRAVVVDGRARRADAAQAARVRSRQRLADDRPARGARQAALRPDPEGACRLPAESAPDVDRAR